VLSLGQVTFDYIFLVANMGELCAHSFEDTVNNFAKHKAVMFQLPMAHDEFFTAKDSFCQRAHDLQMKMERLTLDVEYNRGDKRHCVNHKQHVFCPEFYNILDMMMEPGRWLFDLLTTIDDSLKFETCGGDVVLPGAPPSPATEWHQDWHQSGMMIAVSVALAPIRLSDGPLWIATKASQVPCVAGAPGLVIVRDVSAWHRGSVHTGELVRAMPCFRFSSSKARADGGIHPFRAQSVRKWKPHLRRFIHLQDSISDPRTLFDVKMTKVVKISKTCNRGVDLYDFVKLKMTKTVKIMTIP
jgi:hypothetical protein